MRRWTMLSRFAAAIAVVCVMSLTAVADDGYALEFDGHQQVDGTNSALPQGNAARTMEAWIKPSELHNGTIFNYGTFFDDEESYVTNERAGILYIAGRLYFVGEFNDVIGSTVLEIGEWTHVAASYDGTYMTLYVNGDVDVVAELPAGPHDTTGFDWRIGNGADIDFLREPFIGAIDEVCVWDYARSEAEIQAAMGYRLTGYEPGLVAYYNLNDDPGSTTAEDRSRSMSDGELYAYGEYDLPEWVDGHEQMVPNGGFGPYDRPVFLVFSLPFVNEGEPEGTGEFVNGGKTYFINIGNFIAGQELPETRFELLEILEQIELPDGLMLEDLNGSEFTIIGSLNTFSASSIHLISPSEEPIPPEIQEAFFLASPFLDLLPEFPAPTTGEVAQFVFDVGVSFGVPGIGPEPGYGPEDIESYIFIPGEDPLVCTDCQAEGDMFPHDDPTKPLFGYEFTVDEDTGTLDVAVRLKVDLDLKPGDDKNIVNYKSKGDVWCAILWSEGFDPLDEVVADTVRLGNAEPLQTKEEDVNDDGHDDLVLKFDREDIGLTADTEKVKLTGETYAGGLIEGEDSVVTVPSKK